MSLGVQRVHGTYPRPSALRKVAEGVCVQRPPHAVPVAAAARSSGSGPSRLQRVPPK